MHASFTRAGWLFVLPLSLLCLSGCESLWPKTDENTVPSSTEAPITPPAPSTANNPPGAVGVRSRLLGSRTLTLPPARALEVSSRCNFANETGYKGDAVVEVKAGVVRQMRVLVDVPEPNKGRCIFDMTGMVQTKSTPSVELHNRTTGCTARMWEQGQTAVVSFSQCAKSCSNAESFKYVWPVLIHRKGDRCD
jgi:hypothetical protein